MTRFLLLLACACGRVGFASLEVGDGPPGGGGDGAPSDGTSGGDGVAVSDAPSGPPNIVFVTSTTYAPGSLGGLAGADDLCAQRALAGGLDGTYVAWLSTTTMNARDRLAGSRGWVRVDGLPFVDRVDDLIAGRVWYPPRVDELGVELSMSSDQRVISGTQSDGTTYTAGTLTTCSDWTVPLAGDHAQGGDANGTSHYWTQWLDVNCDQPARLYCFGVGRQGPVGVVPTPGRLAFLSSPWNPGLGRVDADAHCQSEADAASLGGTFLALLPVAGSAASARFDTGGAPWVRVDGVPVFAAATDLTSIRLATALNRFADGSPDPIGGFPRVWTGHGTPNGAPATAPCQDWFSSDLFESTGCGEEHFASPMFFTGCGSACSEPHHLYCLQP